MARFRRRQDQEIEAFRPADLDLVVAPPGDNWVWAAPDWFEVAVIDEGDCQDFVIEIHPGRRASFHTVNDEIVTQPGDWIIRSKGDGMVYPCPAHVFNALFEEF